MDKREIGGLGLSPRSVEQLERVIDTADTVLYPAHLMIGGWRMFFAAVLLAAYGLCYGLWWVCDSIYHFGVLHTVADAYHNTAALVSEFPFASAIVVLVVVVPVFLALLPIFRWFTELLMTIWFSLSSPFVRAPRPGLITAAEILTRGYDPDDFDFEQIDGVVYGRRRGA
jgi:hypothetical protein